MTPLIFTSIVLAFFAFATNAQSQSKPFYLVLHSDDKKIDGKALTSCHEGAAIEGLCLGPKLAKADPVYQTYRLNNTHQFPNSGVLTWVLHGGNFNESEPMRLWTEPSTNVAIALFEPSYDTTQVNFDKNNRMYIKAYMDDRVTPPTDDKPRNLYQWYICTYNYSAYVYQVLCWVNGIAKPQNPSCKKVGVERVFKK